MKMMLRPTQNPSWSYKEARFALLRSPLCGGSSLVALFTISRLSVHFFHLRSKNLQLAAAVFHSSNLHFAFPIPHLPNWLTITVELVVHSPFASEQLLIHSFQVAYYFMDT